MLGFHFGEGFGGFDMLAHTPQNNVILFRHCLTYSDYKESKNSVRIQRSCGLGILTLYQQQISDTSNLQQPQPLRLLIHFPSNSSTFGSSNKCTNQKTFGQPDQSCLPTSLATSGLGKSSCFDFSEQTLDIVNHKVSCSNPQDYTSVGLPVFSVNPASADTAPQNANTSTDS